MDGANPLQLFRHITVPSIGTTLELLVVLASIFSFKQFTIIFLMTGGGPSGATETIVIRIFNTAFRFYDYSYATALGVAGFVVSLVIAFFFILLQVRRTRENALIWLRLETRHAQEQLKRRERAAGTLAARLYVIVLLVSLMTSFPSTG